jgi:hypothetical protein
LPGCTTYMGVSNDAAPRPVSTMVLKEHIEQSRTCNKRKVMWMTTLSNSRTSYQRQNGDEINMTLLPHLKKDW